LKFSLPLWGRLEFSLPLGGGPGRGTFQILKLFNPLPGPLPREREKNDGLSQGRGRKTMASPKGYGR
jgi:hypothetical protein